MGLFVVILVFGHTETQSCSPFFFFLSHLKCSRFLLWDAGQFKILPSAKTDPEGFEAQMKVTHIREIIINVKYD